MKNLSIAVIGAGTAGLSAACFLQKNGNNVTIFEKFDQPKPLGAGLLIQPTGIKILSKLGLDKEIIEKGSVIDELYGRVYNSKFTTLSVKYSDHDKNLFGVGTHRGNLFGALYSKAVSSNIKITSSTEVTDIKKSDKQNIVISNNDALGKYDLIIDSSGQNSILRKKYAKAKLDKPYAFGALWAVVKIDKNNRNFRQNFLEQRYKNSDHMIGILPIGKEDGDKINAAYFWSIKDESFNKWKGQNFEKWKNYAVSLWPETEPLLEQLNSHNDLTMAHYRDVILKKYHAENLVFIGDSAHCTSPQLGQGANLALSDAYILSQCIMENSNLNNALESFTNIRKDHLKFYQSASRLLTPFFQSDSVLFPKLRTLLCGASAKIPFTRKYAAKVLCGIKSGIFKNIDINKW